MQKSKSRHASSKSKKGRKEEKKINHDVTIMGTPFRVESEKGEKLSEFLERFAKDKNIQLHNFSIMLNGKMVKEQGTELSDDPVLIESVVVSLLQKIAGG